MIALADGELASLLGLDQAWVKKSKECVSSDNTVETYLAKFDVVFGDACPSKLLNQLKEHIRRVSEDLAAISFPDGASDTTHLRVLWTSVLAILLAHKKKCIFKCLTVLLAKARGTTQILLHARPAVDDISKVDELLKALVGLVSRSVPRRILFFFRRPMNPDKIVNDSQAHAYLSDLFISVRGLQNLGLPSRVPILQ
ncbi:hypothetical protein DL96DRAFT_1613922 [Flagelloscypha sp. PMI_526]|nr:hypothetical protein DL96DRAFT_1613922 [Flagelloscypha sp. PMI_526]